MLITPGGLLILPNRLLPCLVAVLATACSTGTSASSDAGGGIEDAGILDASVDTKVVGTQDSSAPPTDSGGAKDSAVDIGMPSPSTSRPRVFMALHGSNYLADTDAAVDDQWTFVRRYLDGIWGNNAYVSAEEEANLWYKITTRTLISEWDAVQTPDAGWVPVGVFSGAQAAHPDLMINREAITFFVSPSAWNTATIAGANAEYVTNPNAPLWQLYQGVFTGWQPQDFTTELDGGAERAFEAGKGAAFECPLDGCSGGGLSDDAVKLIKAIHAQGAPFVWFASNNTMPPDPEWPAKFKETYDHFASLGLWQPTDVVMIINYDGLFPAVPETVADGGDAPTVTGMLYWALHQTPIGDP
jgi:hypothetical protein